jgi:hypothetical protein
MSSAQGDPISPLLRPIELSLSLSKLQTAKVLPPPSWAMTPTSSPQKKQISSTAAMFPATHACLWWPSIPYSLTSASLRSFTQIALHTLSQPLGTLVEASTSSLLGSLGILSHLESSLASPRHRLPQSDQGSWSSLLTPSLLPHHLRSLTRSGQVNTREWGQNFPMALAGSLGMLGGIGRIHSISRRDSSRSSRCHCLSTSPIPPEPEIVTTIATPNRGPECGTMCGT